MKASPSPSPLAPGTDQHVQGAQEEDGGEVDFEFKRRTDPAKFHLEASVRTERVARGRVSEAAAPLEGLVTGLGMGSPSFANQGAEKPRRPPRDQWLSTLPHNRVSPTPSCPVSC